MLECTNVAPEHSISGGDAMPAHVIIEILCALGLVCTVWTICGLFLSDERRDSPLSRTGAGGICSMIPLAEGNGAESMSTGGCGSAGIPVAMVARPGN